MPLRDASATVEAGEAVSAIGPSGTGRSTLICHPSRLETPTPGPIVVDGAEMCDPGVDLDAMRRKMGMVLQSHARSVTGS